MSVNYGPVQRFFQYVGILIRFFAAKKQDTGRRREADVFFLIDEAGGKKRGRAV